MYIQRILIIKNSVSENFIFWQIKSIVNTAKKNLNKTFLIYSFKIVAQKMIRKTRHQLLKRPGKTTQHRRNKFFRKITKVSRI
jgi:hypothetical protein